ncbi:hypothetical protein [Acaryochloris marina]|uniref:hypothetical protein n=1 Tax=Acaryochloris marina TaxID=155978 RepID=UPI001BAFA179|nr:hypothetical protein [Acaryochloris marina]QUY45529.1 hypothetical protein I1H34_27630 [Acaryochloris marina S15]
MKLITNVKIEQSASTEVIDSAAKKVGMAASQVFLFVIHKEIQGWKNFTILCSWGLSKVSQKHGPIFDEVKGNAVAVFRKGCRQETLFIQTLIKTQLTDRIDAHWELHDKAIDWFKVQTQAFLADSPVEDTSEVEAEDQAPDVLADLEEVASVAEVEKPISEVEESSVMVFDPDPLDDELAVPQDPTPVVASGGGKRRTAKKKVESSLSSMMREEAAKS